SDSRPGDLGPTSCGARPVPVVDLTVAQCAAAARGLVRGPFPSWLCTADRRPAAGAAFSSDRVRRLSRYRAAPADTGGQLVRAGLASRGGAQSDRSVRRRLPALISGSCRALLGNARLVPTVLRSAGGTHRGESAGVATVSPRR